MKQKHVKEENEPELKLEFIKKIKEIEKQKSIGIKSFAERYGIK